MSEIERKAFYDPAERKFTFATFQDVEPILEQNKELRSITQRSDVMRHKATIPLNIIHQWLQEEWNKGNTSIQFGGDEFDRLIQRKLEDPDWKHLRTDSAQVQGFMGFGS